MLLWPFNKYPGTDYETFNWEWILKTVKEWVATMQTFKNDITAAWKAMRADWKEFKISLTDDWQDYQDNLNDQWQDFIDDTYKDQITEILEQHPEWVTTVMDGAITEPKINAAFLREIKNCWTSPELFGAAADGVTDDSAAFTRAIASGLPLVLTGSYKIKNVQITHDYLIVGTNATIMPFTNNESYEPCFVVTNSDFTIENVAFDWDTPQDTVTSGSLTCYGVIDAYNSTINTENVTFKNLRPSQLPSIATKAKDRSVCIMRAVKSNWTGSNIRIENCGNCELCWVCPDNSADDNQVIFLENIDVDNCDHSLNLLAKDITINNVTGSYAYDGSIINSFAIDNNIISNVTIEKTGSNTFDVIDTSEGCLFRSKNTVLNNVNHAIVNSKNLVAKDSGVRFQLNQYGNTLIDFQLDTYTDVNQTFDNCDVETSSSNGYEGSLKAKYTNCDITNIITGDKITDDSIIKVVGGHVTGNRIRNGKSELIGCELVSMSGNKFGGDGLQKVLSGCWAASASAPYNTSGYIITGCHNINMPA